MGDFNGSWAARLMEWSNGTIDEQRARTLVTEIYEAAAERAVRLHEEEVAQREAEREE
ncbi:hypothetical protein H7827_07465 [Streptomyces sp. JH002]|uniref:Uncharacterized protein n=1 Tax=Streptomyces xiamenensis TaxID=408015 RepID=A0A0F7CPY6_9ACTN|nr:MULTISPECIES: hypothetical protein [Streptomyces]AKG45476.1 hypothetical protein SXIM_40920 [Streptomyces xiamenensis]MCU4749218.1 hypothetical protein [Streptomyces sp. G-5]QQN77242.1 hypothetical protein IPZ77_07095 [Streptomyces sp. XC 2026]